MALLLTISGRDAIPLHPVLGQVELGPEVPHLDAAALPDGVLVVILEQDLLLAPVGRGTGDKSDWTDLFMTDNLTQ